MKTTLLSIAFFCVALFGQAQSPTADQVIDKYLAAIGGKEAISKIQDLVISSSSESPRGTAETEVKVKMPNKYVTSTYMMGNEVNHVVCDGVKVSMQSGFMGNQQTNILEGAEALGTMIQSSPFPEMLYDQYKVTKTVVGQDTVAGKLAWKIEFALAEGRKWTESFDMESGLKLKRTVNMDGMRGGPRGGAGTGGQQGPAQATQGGQPLQQGQQGGGQRRMGGGGSAVFSNYKEIKDGNGVKIPFTREQGFGQFTMKIEVSSAKANKGIKDSVFEIK